MRPKRIKEHTRYHDAYLEKLARAINAQVKGEIVKVNVPFDRSSSRFDLGDPPLGTAPAREEAFFEYDLVAFEAPNGVAIPTKPRWFAEFTADDRWSRQKFFYEAWRWIWFSRAIAQGGQVPSEAWIWRPGTDPELFPVGGLHRRKTGDDELKRPYASIADAPLVYYTLPMTPFYSMWLKGIPADIHVVNFGEDFAIPNNLNICCLAPNAFEGLMLGAPGIFSSAYRGTTKSRRG